MKEEIKKKVKEEKPVENNQAINDDPNKFPPEEADLKERLEGFNKELLPLLGKYELGLTAVPKITPDGRLAAFPFLISVRGKAEKPGEEKAPIEAVAPAPKLDNPAE